MDYANVDTELLRAYIRGALAGLDPKEEDHYLRGFGQGLRAVEEYLNLLQGRRISANPLIQQG